MLRKVLYLFIIFFGLSFSLRAQVNADFQASTTAGCGPLIVQFTNLSTGSGLSYQWNFGNGNSSTSANPSATYINPGVYTVTLTATNGGQSDTETKTGYITVYQKPAPDFSASIVQGCFPLSVDFGDLSIPGSSGIQSWFWDFGDGNVSTQPNPTHVYQNTGVYDVTLLLIDSNNCQDDITFSDYITVSGNFPTVDFTGNPLFGCNPPTQVNFLNNSTGSGALNYTWKFGDGQTSSATNPSHTYTSAGQYPVTLIVSDQVGCTDSLVRPAYVNVVDSVIVDFLSSTVNACQGETVSFFDNSTATPISWEWDFGDGNTSTLQNPTHIYNTPGTYTVTLTADYQGSCSGTEVKTGFITVAEIPTVSFTADETQGCGLPFSINFTNTSSGATSYLWDFGDGGTATTSDPGYDYMEAGSYTVSLTATNDSGCSVTETEVAYINITEVIADFVPDKFGFCLPLTVNFADSSTSDQPIVSWQWDFGDGNTSTEQHPQHIYTNTGVYTITLIVEDASGCTDTLERPNLIYVSTPPVADFTGGPYNICSGQTAFFYDASTNATDWYWDFGDMEFSTEQNPEHEWNDSGYFDVMLVAFNNGCPDTIIFENYAFITPPIPRFEVIQDCSSPLMVSTVDESIGAASYSWDWGDGSQVSTQQDPSHTYSSSGLYTITLTVTSDTNSCEDSYDIDVQITNPQANFSAVNNSGCGPLDVVFTDVSNDAVIWAWDFGDGSTSAEQNPVHTYQNPGSYDVRLIIGDVNGCMDTIEVPNVVNVSGSTPAFNIVSQVGCDSLAVEFADSSYPTGTVLAWYWDFGDGNTSTQQNPSHIYQNDGVYTISLTIDDDAGCTYTSTLPDAIIYDSYPDPAFNPSATNICRGVTVDFTNFTTGATSYLWDFGDGGTSTDQNPSYTYDADGLYTISLTATNERGCDTTLTFVDMIFVGSPDADFSASPTAAVCPPLLVTFTNLSTPNATTWVWDFGDSTSSTQQNPQHIYTEPGSFGVQLIVFSDLGCSDTIFMDSLINLSGPIGSFTYAPDSVGCPPFDITYEATSANATSFTWDFGDGSLGDGPTVTHTYTEVGEFYPVLILEDVNGCSFILQSDDTISVEPLAVSVGLDTTVCREQSVQLEGSGGSIYSWSPATGLDDPNISNPIATPDTTTTYYLLVQEGQCENTDSITIVIAPTPIADFSFNEVCLGDEVCFNDLSTIVGDSIISWDWDFGDATTSADTSPCHFYIAGGEYHVTLITSSNNGCVDSHTDTVNIFDIPEADFTVLDVCFKDSSIFVDQTTVASGIIGDWNWDFGDGNTSTEQNPMHLYTADSTYTITLSVGSTSGCSDTITQEHTVHAIPEVDFELENSCLGVTSSFFDSTTINTGNIVEWNWHFGDGDSVDVQHPVHDYDEPGSYTVTLTAVSNYGCETSANQTITIYPLPVSSFSINGDSSCTYPVSVQMMNASTGASGYAWDFGNSETSTATNPAVIFDTVGTYMISLTATNQYGCTDDTSLTHTVFPIPMADFNFGTEKGCEPLAVQFNDLSNNAQIYQWQFSDGETATLSDPTHIFVDPGFYDVSLIIFGPGGCSDTVTYNNVIEVWENPTADFTYTVSTTPEIDGTVHFFDQSGNVVSWQWAFGDGDSSNLENPTHQYSFHGDKPVSLIVTDSRGCMDTLDEFINVDFYGGLYVPNALIPNSSNNGINIFKPAGVGLKEYTLQIFDKWGNLLWESSKLEETSPAEGWDGTYEGEVVPLGAYVWQINAVFDDENETVWPGKVYENGEIRITGSVTVLK